MAAALGVVFLKEEHLVGDEEQEEDKLGGYIMGEKREEAMVAPTSMARHKQQNRLLSATNALGGLEA